MEPGKRRTLQDIKIHNECYDFKDGNSQNETPLVTFDECKKLRGCHTCPEHASCLNAKLTCKKGYRKHVYDWQHVDCVMEEHV
jgi:hypothetical protein